MSDGGRGTGAPGFSVLAATVVRKRAEVILRDWRSSCPTSDAVDHARVIELIADGLGRCAGNTRGGHRHEGLDDVFAPDDLEGLLPPDISCLREVVRRQVLIDLPSGEALAAAHCVSAVLDDLHERSARRLLAHAESQARTDVLTGLGNRRAADETITTAVANSLRHERPLVLLSLDVDHLKRVNDEEGHEAGDAVLIRLAESIREGIRTGDSAFRVGGDEFLVVLPDATPEEATLVVERITEADAPAFSVGVASVPKDAGTVTDLVNLADQRLLAGRRVVRGPAAEEQEAFATGWAARAVGLLVLLTLVLLPTVALGYRAWSDDNAPLALAAILVAGAAVAAGSGLTYRTEGRAPLARAIAIPLAAIIMANGAAVGAEVATRHQVVPAALERVFPSSDSDESDESDETDETDETRPVARPGTPAGDDRPFERAPKVQPEATPPISASIVQPPTGAAGTTRSTAPTSTTTTTRPRSATNPPNSTTSTTVAKRPTTTTTTSTPPSVVARDDHGEIRGRTVRVFVLDNDSAEGSQLDPSTVAIVSAPSSGEVSIRKDGTIMYKADADGTDDRFRYRVCSTSGACDTAWVVVTSSEQ